MSRLAWFPRAIALGYDDLPFQGKEENVTALLRRRGRLAPPLWGGLGRGFNAREFLFLACSTNRTRLLPNRAECQEKLCVSNKRGSIDHIRTTVLNTNDRGVKTSRNTWLWPGVFTIQRCQALSKSQGAREHRRGLPFQSDDNETGVGETAESLTEQALHFGQKFARHDGFDNVIVHRQPVRVAGR
jgi:hypothetical protein